MLTTEDTALTQVLFNELLYPLDIQHAVKRDTKFVEPKDILVLAFA